MPTSSSAAVSREDFLAARQLRWIQYSAAGVESILYPELVESPVVLTNMQRMFSPTISENGHRPAADPHPPP